MKHSSQRIGILGGAFDPVHNGHIALARKAREWCALDCVKLIPTGVPVHRDAPVASAEQRIAMLELARTGDEWLQVDPRECRTNAPSYTFDTATALRAEHPDATLFLLIGLDAFLAFDRWHRWQDLLGLVHLLVAVRPGYAWASCRIERDFRQSVNDRLVASADAAAQHAAGKILHAALDLPDVSSTQVRRMVRMGEDISALVPTGVAAYIADNQLYR
ncbi:MAG TPA: nicotinate-nucleotide adenylyltransferase [Pseudomonadales bacterium]